MPFYCASCTSAIGTAAGSVGNGLAGGTIAGLIAICVYLGGQRSRSRSQKFKHARMLLVDLDLILFALSDDGIDRHMARLRYRRTRVGRSYHQYSDEGRAVPPERFTPGMSLLVYEGLINSGGMSHFGVLEQQRLHTFYGYLRQGNYERAARMARSLILCIRQFRNDNAPLRRAATLHLLLVAPTLGRRLRLPWRRRPGSRSAGRHSGAGRTSSDRMPTILGPPGE